MANNGKPSEQAFELRIGRLPHTQAKRVFDAAALYGINGRAVADFPRPSDYIVYAPGGIHLAEVKSSENKTSFPFSQIEKGQRNAAATAAACKSGSSYIFYIHSLHLQQWFLMNADEFVADIKAGIKSRKWEDFRRW